MPLVRPRMNSYPVCPRIDSHLGRIDNRRYTDIPLIPQQRNFIQIYAQFRHFNSAELY
jgi:hypothetical protein